MAKTQGSAVSEVRARIKTKMGTVKERKVQRDATLTARVRATEELLAEIAEAVAFLLECVEANMDTEIAVLSEDVGGEAKRRVEEILAGKRAFLPAPASVRVVEPAGGGDDGKLVAQVGGGSGLEVAASGRKR